MNMSASTFRLLMVVVMLGTAVGLFAITYNSTHQTQVVQVSPTNPAPLQTTYLVAAHALNTGTLARDEDLTTRQVVATELPRGAIVDSPEARQSLRGALIRNFVDAGSPITADDVLRPRERGFIAAVLQPNMRAVSVGVNEVSGVAGFIWPGDRVDVVLTQESEKNKNISVGHGTFSETILSNVRVIGVDQDIAQGTPSGNSTAGRVAKTVTLEVNPQQVEVIAAATQLGRMSLSIRPPDNQSNIVAGSSTTYASDFSQALASKVTTMTVVSGDKSTEYHFPR